MAGIILHDFHLKVPWFYQSEFLDTSTPFEIAFLHIPLPHTPP